MDVLKLYATLVLLGISFCAAMFAIITALNWFSRQKECDQIEIAIQLLIIIVSLCLLILKSS